MERSGWLQIMCMVTLALLWLFVMTKILHPHSDIQRRIPTSPRWLRARGRFASSASPHHDVPEAQPPLKL